MKVPQFCKLKNTYTVIIMQLFNQLVSFPIKDGQLREELLQRCILIDNQKKLVNYEVRAFQKEMNPQKKNPNYSLPLISNFDDKVLLSYQK